MTVYPELKDIQQAIKKYAALNPSSTIVFGMVAYKKSDEQCDCCGGQCDCVDENKSTIGAFGQLDDLRFMLNNLRDCVEDGIDETGHVDHLEGAELIDPDYEIEEE